jgi:catechol 2,3-dioxygenase-like lactoylglutathione lyase family enzyme
MSAHRNAAWLALIGMGFVTVCVPAHATAQSEPSSNRDSLSQPFASARPYLVALSVADARGMHRWYSEALGFHTLRAPYSPVPGVVAAFLELNGFRLELLQLSGSRSRVTAMPDSSNSASLHGFVKLGLSVDDVDRATGALRAHGVRPFFGPASDTAFRVRHALFRDPEGNVVQLFRPLPAN